MRYVACGGKCASEKVRLDIKENFKDGYFCAIGDMQRRKGCRCVRVIPLHRAGVTEKYKLVRNSRQRVLK